MKIQGKLNSTFLLYIMNQSPSHNRSWEDLSDLLELAESELIEVRQLNIRLSNVICDLILRNLYPQGRIQLRVRQPAETREVKNLE